MRRKCGWWLAACLVFFLTANAGALTTGYTDIALLGGETHDIRFTSGNAVYVEGLVDGVWSGRYWNGGGKINVPYELLADSAFELRSGQLDLSSGWKWVQAHEEPRMSNGARHFVVELSSTKAPVTVFVHTALDGTPILERWLEIKSTGSEPLGLTTVNPWTGRLWRTAYYFEKNIPPDLPVFTLGSFTRNTHGWEGWLEWKPLKETSAGVEPNERHFECTPAGCSALADSLINVESHVGHGFKSPFFAVRNEIAGEYFIGALAWSGNWDLNFYARNERFSVHEDGPGQYANLWFRAGPSTGVGWSSYPALYQRVVAPGESVTTPAVNLGPVQGDLDSSVQAMHDHVRATVEPPRDPKRAYLIQYAVPGDQGFIARFAGDVAGMNEKNIYQQIDVAHALGAELFIVDAGWWDIYGEWTPSPDRFPHGLAPIADYIHSKGMLFGLYNEVQGGRGDWTHSAMYKQHPDWFIPPYALIDMTNPEAVDFVHQQIRKMVQDYKVDLFRLDYNPGFDFGMSQHTRNGLAENDYWRYYEATYRLFEQVKKEFPQLILQQAAAGGGRNDFGFVGRFDEQYTTDGLDIPESLQNLSGQTLGLPIEMFASAFGIPPHSANRGHLDTHLRATFTLGTPWLAPVAPSLKDLSPETLAKYQRYAELYKHFIRPLLPTCKIYHHAPVNARDGVDENPWFAMEFASPDRTKGWATLVKLYSGPDWYVFKPRGLDPGKSYKVTIDSLRTEAVMSGLELSTRGLPVHLESTEDSELLLFEAVSGK
jgi:alpha-galactosidase